jgi:Lrp/AsnC family transcriptional regulator for asnA, asnC and gidA
MVDNTSLRIIMELCRDGRSSNARLARRLGISALTVAKRISAMLEEDIIAIKAVPNPEKMGFQASAFIGLNVALKEIDGICARLKDNLHVNLVVTCFGQFDVLLLVYFHEWVGLQTFMKEELARLEGVRRVETYLVAEARKRYQGMFDSSRGRGGPAVLDAVDQQLIEALMRNGRPNYSELADKLGLSTSTISRRIAALVRGDIIKILAVPNPAKMGYAANAFIAVRADLAKVGTICDRLAGYPEVFMVLRLMNGFDILFGVHSPNPGTLYDFLKTKVASIDGILNTETFIRGNYLYFSADAMFLSSLGSAAG